jgi:SAM-dependent methyltransferase
MITLEKVEQQKERIFSAYNIISNYFSEWKDIDTALWWQLKSYLNRLYLELWSITDLTMKNKNRNDLPDWDIIMKFWNIREECKNKKSEILRLLYPHDNIEKEMFLITWLSDKDLIENLIPTIEKESGKLKLLLPYLYDRTDNRWLANNLINKLWNGILKKSLNELKERSKETNNSKIKILDIGCGNWKLLKDISNYLWKGEFYGIGKDTYQEWNSNHHNINFTKHDIEYWIPKNLENNNFDLILSFFCLQYIKNIDTLLKEIDTMLSKDGTAILQIWFESTIDQERLSEIKFKNNPWRIRIYKDKEDKKENGTYIYTIEIRKSDQWDIYLPNSQVSEGQNLRWTPAWNLLKSISIKKNKELIEQ